MNNQRRKRLRKARLYVTTAKEIGQDILYEEESCLNNIPDSFFDTEKYKQIEENVERLEELVDQMEEVVDMMDEIAK